MKTANEWMSFDAETCMSNPTVWTSDMAPTMSCILSLASKQGHKNNRPSDEYAQTKNNEGVVIMPLTKNQINCIHSLVSDLSTVRMRVHG